ncbi:hypothetical protein BDV98DRAFT_566463 [Pterulicium gracile]|uniref:Uncharacterized protein n=1 Tax=Pterulicium gracile TaxID=1884261 RepID=A0A5C3QIW5_9AGAR|nr:hypothetical protein BDV98DRAFT_566463 [Pterula gracilis]
MHGPSSSRSSVCFVSSLPRSLACFLADFSLVLLLLPKRTDACALIHTPSRPFHATLASHLGLMDLSLTYLTHRSRTILPPPLHDHRTLVANLPLPPTLIYYSLTRTLTLYLTLPSPSIPPPSSFRDLFLASFPFDDRSDHH